MRTTLQGTLRASQAILEAIRKKGCITASVRLWQRHQPTYGERLFPNHRIVFMGTPQFAVPTLRALATSDHHVVACYSRPPRPSGRGRRNTHSPVHVEAERLSLPVLVPETLRCPEEVARLQELRPDVLVVAAYGSLLPRTILGIPPMGCLNVHGSLLPRWRGAAPVQRAILAGDETLGVSIMQMDAGMDTGPVRLAHGFAGGEMSAGEVMERMASMGGEMVLQVLADPNGHPPVPQPSEGACLAAKLTKEEARLDFSRDAIEVARAVRAYNPAPGAWTTFMGERLAIHSCEVVDAGGIPGTVIDRSLTIACERNAIRPIIVQRPGRRAVSVRDMLHSLGQIVGLQCT